MWPSYMLQSILVALLILVAGQMEKYLSNFLSILYSMPTKDTSVLLILDNHESHVPNQAVRMAKDNGIIMATFPPHTRHKLQPLDRCVFGFGPLKKYYNQACNNPGKPIFIYDVAQLSGVAYPKAFTPSNFQSVFRVSNLWPVKFDIFQEDEYRSSYVTERPDPSKMLSETQVITPLASTSTEFDLAVFEKPSVAPKGNETSTFSRQAHPSVDINELALSRIQHQQVAQQDQNMNIQTQRTATAVNDLTLDRIEVQPVSSSLKRTNTTSSNFNNRRVLYLRKIKS